MKRTVYVLMSSYNGSNYIREQIESILSQKDVNIKLVIRDDGSTDNTIDILLEYEKRGKITFIRGENLGYAKSFITLIRYTENNDDFFYSLSDQDDIWDEDKLISAVRELENRNSNSPLLYACGKRILENQKIRTEKISYIEYGFNGFSNGQFVQGCSIVFNIALKKLINKYHYDYIPCAHDHLIVQICKFNSGNIIFDKNPHFTYRIHRNNSIGIHSGGVIGEIKKILLKGNYTCTDILCKQLIETYTDSIDKENYEICRKISIYKVSLKNKLQIIFDRKILRGSLIRKCKVIVELLCNKA